MTELLTKPQNLRSRGGQAPIGIRHQTIEGGFIKITVHQLALMAWMHREGHISRRQWRICFAAFEMQARRRYMEKGRKPLYQRAELLKLIGGQGTGITADLKHLAQIGLLCFTEQNIDLAVSIDQIKIDDISGFWDIYQIIPNRKRSIPIPRRTVRTLAIGLSRATMVTMTALLIRAMFWHKEQGNHRIDGRVTRGWIADIFGVSPRSVTTAMNELIEIGWMDRVPCTQWELNKWGQRFVIHPDWSPDSTAAREVGGLSQSSTPTPQKVSQSSTLLNRTPFPNGKDIKTRRPEADASLRPDRTGVFKTQISKKGCLQASSATQRPKPRLSNVLPEDLQSTDRMLALFQQATEKKLIANSEAGRLDFVALAERAKTEGANPPALFSWLLRHKRFDYITQSDEEASRIRLKSLYQDDSDDLQSVQAPKSECKPFRLTENERFVRACLQVSGQTRHEPHILAHEAKGWSYEQWEAFHEAYQQKDRDRWANDAE